MSARNTRTTAKTENKPADESKPADETKPADESTDESTDELSHFTTAQLRRLRNMVSAELAGRPRDEEVY